MRFRLIIILFTMLAIPIVGIGWLGVSTLKNEQELLRHRHESLLTRRLQDVDDTLSKLVKSYERRLSSQIRNMPNEKEAIRRQIAANRLTRNAFRLDEKGRLIFPSGDDLTRDEQTFLSGTDHIWSTGELFQKPKDKKAVRPTTDCDWFVWHFAKGLQLLYWCIADDNRIAGIELDPVVIASDLIAELPYTSSADSRSDTGHGFRIRLVDVDGAPFYQWGQYEPSPGDASPTVSLNLSPPLASFRLEYFSPPSETSAPFGGTASLGLLFGFGALILVIAGLGVYFVRENSRDARTARDRMTFVNQVSHELKTPLTNLRMYAELLDEYLEEDDDQGRRYVRVIVSESERLSRLIANVLSFARQARGKLTIRRSDIVPDQIIEDTIQRFRPGFDQAQIELERSLNAPETRFMDGDALAQIVANLLSNVEKYAASGKWVLVESRLDEEKLRLIVEDAGEGIPEEAREEIFKPFVRLSNRLTDRAAGTGIGLSISRELAGRHGGRLYLIPKEKGACFCVELNAPKAAGQGRTK